CSHVVLPLRVRRTPSPETQQAAASSETPPIWLCDCRCVRGPRSGEKIERILEGCEIGRNFWPAVASTLAVQDGGKCHRHRKMAQRSGMIGASRFVPDSTSRADGGYQAPQLDRDGCHGRSCRPCRTARSCVRATGEADSE